MTPVDLTKEEENRAMRVYLGGGEGKGYEPAGREQRLRKEYGAGWKAVQKALDEYLEPLISRSEDWDRGSVHEAAAKMDVIIEECFPWFDETARGLMVGCFIYEWK
jgi:hypothetical protein